MGSLLVVFVAKGVEVLLQLDTVFDVVSVQSFVFQGSAVAFDDAVGVGAFAAGSDVLDLAAGGYHPGEGRAFVAGPVVTHDSQRCPQVSDWVEAIDNERQPRLPLGFMQRGVDRVDCIMRGARWPCDRREAVLGGVVHDIMDPPDPTTRGLKFGDIGLPYTVTHHRCDCKGLSTALGELSQLAKIPTRLQHLAIPHRALDSAHRHRIIRVPVKRPNLPMPPMRTLRRQRIQHRIH